MHNTQQMANFPGNEIWVLAFLRMKAYVREQINEAIAYNERQHILIIILKILLPTLYIYAVATDLDKWRSSLLLLMGVVYGIFKIGMFALKFFKELLNVLVAYKEKKIKIEGIHYVYMIIFLCVLLLILFIVLIFLMYK